MAEWYDARRTAIYSLSNEDMNDEEPDALEPGLVAVAIDMDEPAVLVGTPAQLIELAGRIARAATAAEPFKLIEEEGDE